MSDEEKIGLAFARMMDPWQPLRGGISVPMPTGDDGPPVRAPEGAMVFRGTDAQAVQAHADAYALARRQLLAEQEAERQAAEPPPEKPKSAYQLERERLDEQKAKLDALARDLREYARRNPPAPETPAPTGRKEMLDRALQAEEERRAARRRDKASKKLDRLLGRTGWQR